MQAIIAYTIIALTALCIVYLYKKPQLSLGLVFGMYAAEQILIGNVSFFLRNPQLYNYLIGAISVLAIIYSVIRSGMPRIIVSNFVIFFLLFMFSWMSIVWTSAPNSALSALIHFSFEGLLGFVLPLFVIRKIKDFNLVVIVIAVYGVLVTTSLLLFPIAGVGGRVLLVEGGTVLSPANMMGAAMIFIAAVEERQFGPLIRIKFYLLLYFALGLFLTGARTQFFVGVFLSVVILLSDKAPIKMLTKVTIGLLFISVLIGIVFPDFIDQHLASAYVRYSSTSEFTDGYEFRLQSIIECFTLDSPIIGHGLMGWAHMKFGEDVYMYPHNSIAQVYYELGVVGMVLFVLIVFKSYKMGYLSYINNTDNGANKKIILSFVSYLTFSFLMSLKQGTFLSATGIYIAFGCISVLYLSEFNKKKSNDNFEPEFKTENNKSQARFPVLR